MFEATLTTFRTTGTAKRKLAMVPLAVGFHAIVLVGAAMAQMWVVESVSEPMITVARYLTPPTPPPAARAKTESSVASRPTARLHPVQPVPPDEILKEIPKKGSNQDEEDTGVIGGDPESDKPGTKEGAVDRLRNTNHVSREVPLVESHKAPQIITPEMVKPVALYKPDPRYPDLARHVRLQGTVIAQAIIDTRGNVVDVQILRPLGMGCSEAALEAIRSWKYRAATLDGQPVSVYLTITINFVLSTS